MLARSGLLTRAHCICSNIYYGLESVLRRSNARGVIVLEDDLVPGINFYRYFEWVFEEIMLDPVRGANVLSCGVYNRYSKGEISLDERYSLFRDTDYFSPWGWGIARARWEQVRSSWSFTSWDSAMENRIMPRFGLVNYRPLLSHVDCIGNHGINGSRREDCTFYRTERIDTPIDFGPGKARFYEDGLPQEYMAKYLADRRISDPDWRSEWDTKLVPVIWDRLRAGISEDTRRALKRKLPFL